MNSFITEADLERYSGQKRSILGRLKAHVTEWVPVELLEEWSKAKRVASRIDELRDDWLIETRKSPVTKRAEYRLVSKRVLPRARKPHCESCTCSQEPVPKGQMSLGV